MIYRCRICKNDKNNKPHSGREMMFGLRETFDYFECIACGCVQIAKIPENLGQYYPENYYSFKAPSPLKVFLKGPWLCGPVSWREGILRLVSFLPGVTVGPEWITHYRLPKDSAILEVGSGNGNHLVALKSVGYRDLTGIDPFIPKDVRYSNGIQILKKTIADVTRTYDFVMLHHAFEHMPDQVGTLNELGRILKKDGMLLLRIPVISSYAWKTYGMDWPGMDPPRHLYVHSTKSLTKVANDAGFDVVDSFYDGDFTQFVGSEQYQKDISLFDPKSYLTNKKTSIFSKAQIRAFKKLSDKLNREGLGDSGAFYLRKRLTA